MTTKTLNVWLLVLFAISIVANLAVGSNHREPNVRFAPDMVYSIPYDGFAANPHFADGGTLRMPPEGSMSCSVPPLHFAPTAEEALRAGREPVNPLPAEAEQAEYEGAYLFRDYCLCCHGAMGAGDGPVSQRGFPAPPSLAGPNAVQMKDGQMFHLITLGQGNMPAYGSQLSREERWKVILHVRKLQGELAAGHDTTGVQP